ncbi:hypothetical protein TNCV_607441 [Trichonephila clavipes]|nr:hypothetical protein TNCV_607441 [Trichonephila clavipes]
MELIDYIPSTNFFKSKNVGKCNDIQPAVSKNNDIDGSIRRQPLNWRCSFYLTKLVDSIVCKHCIRFSVHQTTPARRSPRRNSISFAPTQFSALNFPKQQGTVSLSDRTLQGQKAFFLQSTLTPTKSRRFVPTFHKSRQQ